MAAKYQQVTLEDMSTILAPLGFTVTTVQGCRESVFGKRVDVNGHHMSLRVFTSVVGNVSRDSGKDAIRVCLAYRLPDGTIKTVGSSKRVNRVPGWQGRLVERLAAWTEQLGPACPKCTKPMVKRKSKSGAFFGCCNYPDCRGTRNVDE